MRPTKKFLRKVFLGVIQRGSSSDGKFLRPGSSSDKEKEVLPTRKRKFFRQGQGSSSDKDKESSFSDKEILASKKSMNTIILFWK